MINLCLFKVKLLNKFKILIKNKSKIIKNTAKCKHTTYPCVPVWEKKRFIDPFDYPLRSKKEILLEQELNPPDFPMKLIINRQLGSELTYKPMQEDSRGKEAKIIINMEHMNLSSLQKKRLIFLLGPRYKNSNVFKIVFRDYDTYQKNLLKAFDLLKLLYIEAKRAPIFHPVRATLQERKRYLRKYFGKTKEEREKNMKLNNEKYQKDLEEFEKLWENRQVNFTEEKIFERVEKRLEKDKLIEEDFIREHGKDRKGIKREELAITKEEVERQFVESTKLTPKAFKLFFKDGEMKPTQ